MASTIGNRSGSAQRPIIEIPRIEAPINNARRPICLALDRRGRGDEKQENDQTHQIRRDTSAAASLWRDKPCAPGVIWWGEATDELPPLRFGAPSPARRDARPTGGGQPPSRCSGALARRAGGGIARPTEVCGHYFHSFGGVRVPDSQT